MNNFRGWENCDVKDGKLIKKKESKYHNKVETVITKDGVKKYHSKWEAEYAAHLQWLESLHLIENLKEQVPFEFKVAGQLICTYIADFVFDEVLESGSVQRVIVDTKSPPTRKKPEYVIKKKLLKALHPIAEFREVLKEKVVTRKPLRQR